MANVRIRNKYEAHLWGTLYAFLAAVAVGALAEHAGYEGDTMLGVLAFSIAAGFLSRWGWDLRRWYRKTRPGYDPLSSMRPKP